MSAAGGTSRRSSLDIGRDSSGGDGALGLGLPRPSGGFASRASADGSSPRGSLGGGERLAGLAEVGSDLTSSDLSVRPELDERGQQQQRRAAEAGWVSGAGL